MLILILLDLHILAHHMGFYYSGKLGKFLKGLVFFFYFFFLILNLNFSTEPNYGSGVDERGCGGEE